MSKLNVTLYRTDDHRVLKVLFSSDYEKNHEYTMLSFKCITETVDVISTSAGSIDGEGNVKLTDSNAELFVNYCENGSELECLVGYYSNNELLDYENLIARFEGGQEIKSPDIEVPYIKTKSGSFSDRFESFFSTLSKRNSLWKVQISCPDDVFLSITSNSDTPTTVTFGENTREVLASDYIFRLDPNIDKLNLPVEMIKNQKYTPQCELGIFEIIEPDFIGARGVYYKCLISNLITISDITKLR